MIRSADEKDSVSLPKEASIYITRSGNVKLFYEEEKGPSSVNSVIYELVHGFTTKDLIKALARKCYVEVSFQDEEGEND